MTSSFNPEFCNCYRVLKGCWKNPSWGCLVVMETLEGEGRKSGKGGPRPLPPTLSSPVVSRADWVSLHSPSLRLLLSLQLWLWFSSPVWNCGVLFAFPTLLLSFSPHWYSFQDIKLSFPHNKLQCPIQPPCTQDPSPIRIRDFWAPQDLLPKEHLAPISTAFLLKDQQGEMLMCTHSA